MSKEEEIKDLNASIYHLLKRSAQFAANLFSDQVGTSGLTHRQFTVLLAVAQNEGASQTQLVRATGIDRSTLADLVARLLKQNLLQRRRTREDGRTNAIKLSAAGRRALSAAMPAATDVDKRLLETIPAESREHFLAALRTLSEAYDAQLVAAENKPAKAETPPRTRRRTTTKAAAGRSSSSRGGSWGSTRVAAAAASTR